VSLRTRALRGGSYLVLRQGLGIGIGVVGVVLLTRAIGPAAYGLYAAALGIYSFLLILCQWGVNIYLVRQEVEPQLQDYHQAFSLLLLLGLAAGGLGILALPFLERWVQLEGFGPVALALFAALPVNLLQLVPLSYLERALDYRRVSLIELSGQIAIYAVALPLAYRGLGPWAPVAGMWVSQLLSVGLLYRLSGYWPRLYWESSRVRAMVGYGLGVSTPDLLYYVRNLVNPLVVGRYVGAEAVGQVALAIRLVEQLSSIIVLASGRLSIPVFARLQEDRVRLVKALTEGTNLQLMTLGPILAGFGFVAPWIIPLMLGSQWLPMLEVYPFIALSSLNSAVFVLQIAALYVLRRIWGVAVFYVVHLGLFACSALLLVPHLGLTGYGLALMIALPSYALLLALGLVYIGKQRYIQTGVWFTAWAIPLFSWQLGPWVWISAIVPLLWPATRRGALQTMTMVLRRSPGH
jgi:O-antigen/teichoic acid export membrane protein